MVASEHPEVIQRKRKLFTTYFLDLQDAFEYGSIDDYGSGSENEYQSSLRELDGITVVTEVGKKR